jgi:hypothetical protein
VADSESAEALAVLSQDTAAQDARQQAERAQRVVAVEAVFKERRFGALWLLASAVAKSERRYLSGRPSKAAIAASRAAGYMEGLRDAACALAGVESGELFEALDKANSGLDFTAARNLVHRSPNMTMASHLDV